MLCSATLVVTLQASNLVANAAAQVADVGPDILGVVLGLVLGCCHLSAKYLPECKWVLDHSLELK